MSDQPASDPAAPAAASAGAGGRGIPTPPPPPGKKVSSKVTTAVGGLAALAAAVTAAVFYGDDVVDAFDGPNGDADADGIAEAPDAETRTADRAERESGDDSMDAFDAVEPVADAPAAAAAVGTPLAPPPVDQPSFDRPAPRAAHQASQQRQEFDDDGPAPRQAPAAPAAAAAGAAAAGAAAAGAATNDEFEASRAQLLARLEAFEAPEGTSPEDAQALKDELRETIESFEPRAGQSASDAMADLRDEFDETMQDFTQDQQIEALIEETQRDNEAEGAEDATPVDPVVPPVDDEVDETGETGETGDIDTDGDGVVDGAETAGDIDTDGDGVVDDTETPDDTEVEGDGEGVAIDPGFVRVDPELLDPLVVDPTLLTEVAPDIDEARLADPGFDGVDGESTDDRHRGEIDATVEADVDLGGRAEVREGLRDIAPDIADAPVLEDPDAGGEITSRFDDGFDDLIQVAVVADPDDGGEATPGTVIGGEAVPQVRATVDPAAVRPTMMDDLGDDTYEQVKAEAEVDPAGILIGMDQGGAEAPVVDATLLAPVLDTELELAPQIPEPEPIDVQIEVPISALDDADFAEEATSFAEDLHSDITPDAPDNLQFGP